MKLPKLWCTHGHFLCLREHSVQQKMPLPPSPEDEFTDENGHDVEDYNYDYPSEEAEDSGAR